MVLKGGGGDGVEEVVAYVAPSNSLWKEEESLEWPGDQAMGAALSDEGYLNSARRFSTFLNPCLRLIVINIIVPFQILIFWPP